MKIVFLDGFTINRGDLSWRGLEALGEFTAYERTAPEEVLQRAENADVLIVNKTALGEEHFKALSFLRLICVAATGFDRVDVKAARAKGITVCNCAGYSSRAVAQMVASLILEVADSVGEYTRRNLNGEWCRSEDFCYIQTPRMELVGKSLGIVGFGNIGQTVAEVMRPFGLKIFAVSSKTREQLPAYVEKLTREEAFEQCDIVSLNCPLTNENREFVNAKLLAKANPKLILVNTARGGLVNEADVADALMAGKLKAYCTDVLALEPPREDCPILHAPRVFVTPHIGWSTPEARGRILNMLIDNIQSFVAGQPKHVVN